MKNKEEIAVKLDLKDRKILFELDFNARIPYTQLAKKVGLSKQGAEYKVNNLIKKGVIKGFYPVINVPKLGYIYCRLLITLQNVTPHKFQEIVHHLEQHHKVFWLFKMQGVYDLLIVIWAKSITEIRQFGDELDYQFGPHIKRKTETIATDVIHLQHRYLLGNKESKEIHIKETPERIEIDSIDQTILRSLCQNGRIPLVEIASQVKESAKVVAYRIKKMEQQKLIEGYRPILDHNLMGYTYYKVFITLHNQNKEAVTKLKQHLKMNPLVIYLVEGIGIPGDIDLELMARSNQELFQFIDELKFTFPALIGEYQTVLFVETLKVRYLPF